MKEEKTTQRRLFFMYTKTDDVVMMAHDTEIDKMTM